jgi:dTDP-4-amino-4,6-dideoxygalactose transaminase
VQRVTDELLQVFGSSFDERELEPVRESLEEGWIGMGPMVERFERALGERLGAEVVMVNSGTSALQLAVELLDLPPGSEIVLPSFTWVGCANAVVLAGHTPVFADVELESANLGVATVEPRLGRQTAAVMVVHYAGKPVRLDEFGELGLPVVEDAAHAVDSALGGRPCGTIGRLGVLSFDSVKNLATPDGGAIVTSDPEVAEHARRLRHCGIGRSGFERRGDGRWWEHGIERAYPKLLPNDVSAGIGLVQLDKLETMQARRRAIWDAYSAELGELDWLALPPGPAVDERHSWFTYLVRVLDGRRDALAAQLLESGIYTTLRYSPLHRIGPYASAESLPATERLADEGLNLPLHPRMSESDLERVIAALAAF